MRRSGQDGSSPPAMRREMSFSRSISTAPSNLELPPAPCRSFKALSRPSTLLTCCRTRSPSVIDFAINVRPHFIDVGETASVASRSSLRCLPHGKFTKTLPGVPLGSASPRGLHRRTQPCCSSQRSGSLLSGPIIGTTPRNRKKWWRSSASRLSASVSFGAPRPALPPFSRRHRRVVAVRGRARSGSRSRRSALPVVTAVCRVPGLR
jgi:hypothetical protein